MFTSPSANMMATASPTPMPSYGATRITRKPSTRLLARRDSPLSMLSTSQGFSDHAPMMQSIRVGDDSSDDEAPQPLSLSKYAEEIIAHNAVNSPERQPRGPPKLRIMRNPSGAIAGAGVAPSSTNPHVPVDSITPAPSLRIKRVPLRGAPVRRIRRTPQGDSDDQPPSQDQENLQAMEIKKDSPVAVASVQRDHREEERKAMAPISANTPHRPAPPPPPKMSVLEAATAAAGASTTKEKKRKQAVRVNGKIYSLMGRVGKGGSGDVYRVMAENSKIFALKRVKLEDADPAAIKGFKGEIDLLRTLQNVERVVRLFDYEVDEEKQELKVVSIFQHPMAQKDSNLQFAAYGNRRIRLVQDPPRQTRRRQLPPGSFFHAVLLARNA
jgi:serine/threonine-protein kinase TTK/MPS1